MSRPDSLVIYEQRDLRLSIKSSLPNVRSTLALAILLWESSDMPSEIIYSESTGDEIILCDSLERSLYSLLSGICEESGISREQLIYTVDGNQLFRSQIEALGVAFELIWKLAKVDFVDARLPCSAERTRRVRFPKKLSYSVNIDIIHSTIYSDKNAYLRVLLSWMGFNLEHDIECEKNLQLLLTALSEDSIYELRDGNRDIDFNQNSIYLKLLKNEGPVDINGDDEPMGSLRILKSLLDEKLNPYLNYYSNRFVTENVSNGVNLSEYQKRVDMMFRLRATKLPFDPNTPNFEDKSMDDKQTNEINYITHDKNEFGLKHNRIIFGAPGTGKSYKLNAQKNQLLMGVGGDSNCIRVTFHPDYTYANFVGTYKPVPYETSEGKKGITYCFMPGPFIELYSKALKSAQTDKHERFLLIIEEINRANVAAVFGDIFQLLDRTDQNISEYPICPTEDIRQYLATQFEERNPDDFMQILLPDNFYIWATMNSADQGVFPLDTAFKRRWDFTYVGINENDDKIQGKTVNVKDNAGNRTIHWNCLRRAINNHLAELGINEDKQLGPYFIGKDVVGADNVDCKIDDKKFSEAFKNKVIMYLFEDAARQKRTSIFSKRDVTGALRYSEICDAFDKKGISIFVEEITTKVNSYEDEFTQNSNPGHGNDE